MNKTILIFYFLLLSLTGRSIFPQNRDVISHHEGEKVTLENTKICLTFDLAEGTYSATDKSNQIRGIYNAYGKINGYSTREADQRSYKIIPVENELGKGVALQLLTQKKGQPELIFSYLLYPEQAYILMYGGIRNTTSESIQVKSIFPVADARLFEGCDLSRNFRAVDGQGGGAATYLRQEPSLLSQNNMLLHFGEDNDFHSLVGGGISYHEFAKFAQVGEEARRKQELSAHPVKGLKLVCYNDLGEITDIDFSKPYIQAEEVATYQFEAAGAYKEAKSIVYAANEVVFQVRKLEPGKPYSCGLSWCDDAQGRKQSVYVEYNGKREQVVATKRLPSLAKGQAPQIVYFNIPPQATGKSLKVIVKSEGGANAVVSEAILFEGRLPKGLNGKAEDVSCNPVGFEDIRIQLYAEDFIGKRVDPGQTYTAGQDGFYLDFITRNPLEAAEQYAIVLRAMQRIQLNHYYFPTICMWYAMEPKYGGNIVMGTNDAPGAVEEMQRVKASGFLKYTTMGIRLVPDCYDDNNENGWWDDEHWQMHGSGKQAAGMELKGAHYREPYETTEKWAREIIRLGGKPFTYFQTAVRSNDYAEKYPGHMLFNESYHKIGSYDWLNKGYSSYDFTDPEFYAHMQDVYRNLKNGGIAGMMFDYPYTGWPVYGGMEDKYCTTAGAYRRIFRLASEGLGKEAYIHERNLTYGSDIALGYISSQRTWGDTDYLTPEMVLRSGLRWYKNRVVVNYDMDAKNLLKAKPTDTPDGLHKLLTMSYVTASRLLLANSFGVLKPEHVFALSRIYPFHQTSQSARPLDAFISDYPRVYGFKINDQWTALTFYNESDTEPHSIGIHLAGTEGRGGAGLNPEKEYYIYDFWNDHLIGRLPGNAHFEQNLRKGEARQMAVREVENNPQVLSTDRHLMQGYLELSDIVWDPAQRELRGKAEVIGNEPLHIAVALNGYQPQQVGVSGNAKTEILPINSNLVKLKLTAPQNGTVEWKIIF